MGKEIIIQSELSISKSSEPQLFLDKRDVVMSQLEGESRAKTAIIIEGPPVYLWPPNDSAFEVLQWRSKSFRKGWDFVNSFAGQIPGRKAFQYALIDDLNYFPKNGENSDLRAQINKLRSSSAEIAGSAIFQSPNEHTKVLLESRLAAEKQTTRCSKLDAEFNARKIIDQVGQGGNPTLYAGNVNKLMLVVVNPDTPEVRSEQLNMMMELYILLRKHPDFQKYSKKWSSEAITDTFRHVWINSLGKVMGLTRPVFYGSHFSFIYE